MSRSRRPSGQCAARLRVVMLSFIAACGISSDDMARFHLCCFSSLIPVRRLAGEKRSEEHTSELQSLMRSSYAVFCLKTKKMYSTHDDEQNHSKARDTNI